jgi:hypothetical protein
MVRNPAPRFIGHPDIVAANPAPSPGTVRSPVNGCSDRGPHIAIISRIYPATVGVEVIPVDIERCWKISSAWAYPRKGRISGLIPLIPAIRRPHRRKLCILATIYGQCASGIHLGASGLSFHINSATDYGNLRIAVFVYIHFEF